MTREPDQPKEPHMTTDTVNPRQALDAAIDAARLSNPVIDHADGRRHALVPSGYSLQDVSDPHRLPPHIKAAATFNDRDSLTNYVNRFSDGRSILFADYDAGTITARLDWHHNNDNGLAPQQAAHCAGLKLRDSLEYSRWNKMQGALHSQEDFARFIEENVADVTDPDQSVLLEICRDLEATMGTAFKSGTRLESGDRSFIYETETRVKGEISVPTEIGLSIPLYHGEEPTDIRAKFRFKATAAGLLLGFAWHRVEYQRQAVFNEMATIIAGDTGLPVFFGRADR